MRTMLSLVAVVLVVVLANWGVNTVKRVQQEVLKRNTAVLEVASGN